MKAISLSLFDAASPDCHSFNSFLQMFAITHRAYRYIYPDWEVVLHTDNETLAKHGEYLTALPELTIKLHNKTQLCKAMLWRITSVKEYDVTICRDIDGLPTLRERQAVEYWLRSGKAAHGITDSISHNIPLMGGMCGFRKNTFNDSQDIYPANWSSKGSDQTYLMDKVYPQVQNDFMLHSFLGMNSGTQTIESDNYGIDAECNKLCNHIGQGGFHIWEHNETGNTSIGAANYYILNPPKEIVTLNQQILEVERKHTKFEWLTR